ncbi:NAD(P)/FAD-dependent oxidoreductase [Amylibacter sp.]|nr:NAD(P)/FAD-dependent oxidoreductase [Amylibacter sp.]
MEHCKETPAAHFDVLIIGAGISGIDAAHHLNTLRPGTSYAILESKSEIGGTWRTHKFPGIRSDSDLFTFGFAWKPWMGVPVATAAEILAYLEEAVDEIGAREKIKFDHKVLQADWCSDSCVWRVEVEDGAGNVQTLTCGFLWTCAGYYNHAKGYTPHWAGMDDFIGTLVHPQCWPEGLKTEGKKVVLIGSGATAATILPALAGKAAALTMLQRSPTYYMARPQIDEFTETLNALDLPKEWYHEIMRRRFLHESEVFVERTKVEPDVVAAELVGVARTHLGDDYDVETHFTPSYAPWKQRVARIPDGDLFTAIRDGFVDVVTDEIERFTATGLVLKSGKVLDADIIVSATGLNLTMFGDVVLKVDGSVVDPAKTFTHRGVMFSGLPNLANVFGYFRSSWTMRAGLVSAYVCRLLEFIETMDIHAVTPQLRDEDGDMAQGPWIDPENFNAGYVMRSLDIMPRQGNKQPWIMTQDYYRDRVDLPAADLEDGTLVFERAKTRSA